MIMCVLTLLKIFHNVIKKKEKRGKEKDIDTVYWKDIFIVTIKLEEMLCLKCYKNISSGRNIGRIFINYLSD